MASTASPERIVRLLLNIAAGLDRSREHLEQTKHKAAGNPEHKKAVQQIDKNIEHLASATLHLRHAAESLSKVHA
jgi:hypothetical protein